MFKNNSCRNTLITIHIDLFHADLTVAKCWFKILICNDKRKVYENFLRIESSISDKFSAQRGLLNTITYYEYLKDIRWLRFIKI